jgi:hypothetical protein
VLLCFAGFGFVVQAAVEKCAIIETIIKTIIIIIIIIIMIIIINSNPVFRQIQCLNYCSYNSSFLCRTLYKFVEDPKNSSLKFVEVFMFSWSQISVF